PLLGLAGLALEHAQVLVGGGVGGGDGERPLQGAGRPAEVGVVGGEHAGGEVGLGELGGAGQGALDAGVRRRIPPVRAAVEVEVPRAEAGDGERGDRGGEVGGELQAALHGGDRRQRVGGVVDAQPVPPSQVVLDRGGRGRAAVGQGAE